MIPSGDDTTNNPHRRRLEQRTIYIYENERLWVGRGYTKKGLLPIPTERGPFSSLDGSINRKTIEDASLALLGAIDDVGAGGGGNVAIMMMCAAGGGRRRSLLPGGSNDDDVGGKDDASEKKTGRRSGSGSGRKSSSSRGLVVRNRGWSFHEEGGDHDDDDRGGFATCFGTDADGPTDVDGWQYFHDFSNQSLSSPNAKRLIGAYFVFVSFSFFSLTLLPLAFLNIYNLSTGRTYYLLYCISSVLQGHTGLRPPSEVAEGRILPTGSFPNAGGVCQMRLLRFEGGGYALGTRCAARAITSSLSAFSLSRRRRPSLISRMHIIMHSHYIYSHLSTYLSKTRAHSRRPSSIRVPCSTRSPSRRCSRTGRRIPCCRTRRPYP